MIEEICLDKSKQVFAKLLDLEVYVIDSALQSLEEKNPYKKLSILKRNGSKRIAYCPKSKELRIVQRAILDKILYQFELDENFFGFCKGKNIISNALYHARESNLFSYDTNLPTWILKIDIKNAFPSIDSSMLIVLFRSLFDDCLFGGKTFIETDWYFGFLHLLLRFTTYNDVLIQGISTSPYLFNLYIQETVHFDIKELYDNKTVIKTIPGTEFICFPDEFKESVDDIDIKELYAKATIRTTPDTEFKYYPFNFSYYADDIVISFNKFIPGLKNVIIGIIESHGLKVNTEKIRLTRKTRSHPHITGVVLNVSKYPMPYRYYPNEDPFGERIIYRGDEADERFYLAYQNNLFITRPSGKKIKTIRGKIHRAIAIIKSGRLPSDEKDGFTINVIKGYISYIKYLSRINNKKGLGLLIPPSLKKPIQEFEILIKEKRLK